MIEKKIENQIKELSELKEKSKNYYQYSNLDYNIKFRKRLLKILNIIENNLDRYILSDFKIDENNIIKIDISISDY